MMSCKLLHINALTFSAKMSQRCKSTTYIESPTGWLGQALFQTALPAQFCAGFGLAVASGDRSAPVAKSQA
jgi:hypothetical protein